ncbi:Stp1/IreP family PP2C-type Ser/Thr phosphatase [candidate division KSB1 bacterium]|nr:Stp1/IreP family PP2C-type Ser/Thr phosphatase [candidate division KSB1 bacterium]NIR70791.1 Stp1/IreP family PP2C-type Ser/Thr phosphatase [candidate division KSB1 bacterium]NIS27804.1 Stp1/IreP family PP2C-type Ser/Thr phosphatase [candidate division KSB1 bacterium]NIT74686.1 Stp1/IreP family PP2C-type Ser/Thr phosphatase [candidate division KSB1 bacterium]NIU28471.1 Stp1/IreP family PP2C-type Ser/Thr phosphatase [candidate division KSB1 bacterium]
MKKEKKTRVTTAAFSDIGKVRKANEDSFFISKNEDLLVVCDGMGGQIAGGLASKIAVETIKDVYYGLEKEHVLKLFHDVDPTLPSPILRLVAAVRIANRRIYTKAAKFSRLRGMGTTVVALALDRAMATMAHVGDSRILRISQGQIVQLTEDHSWLNELIEDNEINEEQIETFSQRNVITRALGTAPTVKIDIHCEKYQKDDIYLLCTDGLYTSVKSEEMNRLFRKNNDSLDADTKALIEKANKRDGTDNITLAAAKVKQNSKKSGQVGVSTTIGEEDEKALAKEDKFIQENYNKQKSTLNYKPTLTMMNQNRFLVWGSFLITAILCFLLGASLQSAKQNSQVKTYPVAQKSTRVGSGKTRVAPDQTAVANVASNLANSNHRIAQIKKSVLSQNAVLAFVFFNSQRDYEDARLDERGMILDKLHPYSDEEGSQIKGDFSIFLIDSSNNVIKKMSGIKLPELATGSL